MKTLSTIIACILIFLGAVAPQEKHGWRGIVPLHSTRADVEAMLGPASDVCHCIYRTDKEAVEIQYASAPCKGSPAGWNVPFDTVLSITVTPKEWERFADLRIDEVKYVKSLDPDNRTTQYTNRNEGIKYTVTETGMVYYISYTPSKDDSQLKCEGFREDADTIDKYSRFDYYSDISFKDEETRLDNFAAWLHEHPDLKGYIVVYGRVQEAKRRATRAKQYLVRVRHIPSKRLVTITGPNRERLEIQLYALPSGLPPPQPPSSLPN